MPRYFAPITVDELKSKIEPLGSEYYKLTLTVEKDLGKVNFSVENINTH